MNLYVDDYRLNQGLRCRDAYDGQKRLATEISEHYGVTVHVGTEISRSGLHKNAFGSWIPILDRNLKPEGYSENEAVSHVKGHGGVLSINHPFSPWKREDLTRQDHERIVQEVVEAYAQNACHGADLIEVGFPDGRHGFSLEEYLALWDGLGRKGVVATGIGVSDAHNNQAGWLSGNNFANWIRAHSMDERDLIKGLLLGDVYMGDPTQLKGTVEFAASEGHRMGDVVIGRGVLELRVRITKCKAGWGFRWVIDGERQEGLPLRRPRFESSIRVTRSPDLGFVRCEVYDGEGRCILLTNPIYYVESMLQGLPSYRIVNRGQR